jgi:hypothetical protein
MGPASLGLEIGVFCACLYGVLLLSAILGLDFLGLALSRPQARARAAGRRPRGSQPREGQAGRAQGSVAVPHSHQVAFSEAPKTTFVSNRLHRGYHRPTRQLGLPRNGSCDFDRPW